MLIFYLFLAVSYEILTDYRFRDLRRFNENHFILRAHSGGYQNENQFINLFFAILDIILNRHNLFDLSPLSLQLTFSNSTQRSKLEQFV